MPPHKPQSRAGLPFKTADEAAFAAIDEINPSSIKEGVEFAGRIYFIPQKKVYCFFRPNRGDAFTSSAGAPVKRVDVGGKIIDAQNVGTYHTHAGLSDSVWMPDQEQWSSEIFSPIQDLLIAMGAKEYSWLGTPFQRILKFTPPALLPVGDPEKYKGKIEVLRNVYVLPEITITPE